MTITGLFEAIAKLSGVFFVVASMLAMGLSLTVPQIIGPLRNIRLVILALVANFVLVPLLALGIAAVIPLDQELRTGLIVVATAAGAPFLPKLVMGAKGNVAFGVGLMVMLMVLTIVYMPIVLPLLLPGVTVDAAAIAKSLVVLMLVPLALGLLIRSHSADTAAEWQPTLAKASTQALLVLMVVAVGLNVSNVLDLIGTGGLLAMLLFVVGSLVIGFVLGGSDAGDRCVMGLGTAQRNASAAIVVTAGNFAGSATLPYVLVGAILMLLILLPLAKRLGQRPQAAAAASRAGAVRGGAAGPGR